MTERDGPHDDKTAARGRVTPRQALVYAALCGWYGDDPGPWISPVAVDDILAWAKSHYRGPVEDLAPVFEDLVTEGLFFEVCHGLFDPPCYYCKFDSRFLHGLPDGSEHTLAWDSYVDDYDDEHGSKTWKRLGLCAGQGSQGPSDAPWGPRLGASCCWFEDGSKHCRHQLAFAKGLTVVCPGCGQDTVREELKKFGFDFYSDGNISYSRLRVCKRCVHSREALVKLCKRNRWFDWDRTLEAFEKAQGHTEE